ncbi:MAG: cupin domain-containing protein [Cyclobacteriaceae bacterium]
MDVINILEKFGLFADQWNPRIIGELNGQYVKLARIQGEFDFHHHDNEDELFLVIKGKMAMAFRDKVVELEQGELLVVPHGVDHKPMAEEECLIMLFEPKSTMNTGNTITPKTREKLDWI